MPLLDRSTSATSGRGTSSIFAAAVIGGVICFSLRGIFPSAISGGMAFILGFLITYASLIVYALLKAIVWKLDQVIESLRNIEASERTVKAGEAVVGWQDAGLPKVTRGSHG